MSGNADPYAATMREEREKLAANPADEGLESAYGRLREYVKCLDSVQNLYLTFVQSEK